MKKNLISVIILALVFVNFVLTALLVFTVLPETKKANKMIEDVCAAIDLELNSGAASGTSNVPIDQIEDYALNAGESMTISLATDENGKSHYAVGKISLSMNKKSDGYKAYCAEGLKAKESIIIGLSRDTSSASRRLDKSLRTSRCIARFTGLAPNSGS